MPSTLSKHEVLGCFFCDYTITRGYLANPHAALVLCYSTACRGKDHALAPLSEVKEKKRLDKLRGYLYCRDCDKLDQVQNFPKNTNGCCEEENGTICPLCGSNKHLVNVGGSKLCVTCKEVPALISKDICLRCEAKEDMEGDDYLAEARGEYF